jgi:sigma-B regulation protein RsbU (phosphoserine phosphatase)
MIDKMTRSDIWIFSGAVFGLAVFLYLYPRLYPQSAIRMDIDKDEIVQQGRQFVTALGYDLTAFHRRVNLEHDADRLAYLNMAFGSSTANRMMADSVTVYYWSIRWSKESEYSIQLGSGSEEEEVRERVDHIFGDVRLYMDLKGRPIHFDFRHEEEEEAAPPDTVDTLEETDRETAERLAASLMDVYGGSWFFDEVDEKPNTAGTVRRYTWRRDTRVAGLGVSIDITVKNGRVQTFNESYTIPKPFSDQKRREDWEGAATLVLFLLLFILVVIYFIMRLRSDLIDFKSGLVPAILVFAGYFFYFWGQATTSAGEPIWALLLGFVITAPFVAGGIWALSSVGESLTRETWVEKLIVLDTLRRKPLFPSLGLALFRGIALAFMGLGLASLLNYLGIGEGHGYFTLGDSPLYFWAFRWPSVHVLSKSLFSSLYIVITFCLFLMTIARRRFRRSIWIGAILVVLWSFVSMPIPRLMPYVLRMGVNGLVGLLFVLFFLRYEFVTVAAGALSIPILFYGTAALHAGSGFFLFHGLILFGLLGIVLILAVVALRSEAPSGDMVTYVPDYLQRIYERERIQRELEIARNVQLTFLPRKNPEIKGMDIATLCLPAKEVGGDYYDFVEMGPKKLGVAIGDVSGKGISAAFYMTLTKGFLKSQAQNISSPRQILINMNELFYENSERGFFISMIYGIFDLKARTLTFSRAGHNPMILRRPRKGTTEEINPPGIALGLERGDVFNHTIEERTVGIEKNDVFLFYTDGMNEAQNRLHEEFGEDRLREIVEAYTEAPAAVLLDRTQREIQRFTADAPQHDDMTAVIIKIT